MLVWEPVRIGDLIDTLVKTVEETRRGTPEEKSRLQAKLMKWSRQLAYVREKMGRVRNELAPALERTLGVSLTRDELLIIAMFQPSTKNLFLEIETHYRGGACDPLGERFEDLIALSEMARVLALVGDAALSLAVIHSLWEPKAARVGRLTEQRAELVSNSNMATLCDRWNLYEYRIHFDPATSTKSEINHIKGTLVEAVYGVVYIHDGLEKVREIVAHLKPTTV